MIEAKDLPPELSQDSAPRGRAPVSLMAAPALDSPAAASHAAGHGPHAYPAQAAEPAGATAGATAVATAGAIPGATAVKPLAPMADTPPAMAAAPSWVAGLEQEARSMLQAGQPDVWEALTRKFEAQLIHTALAITRGRRIEAAQKLGIGRNTITRKIQELGLDD